MGVCRGSGRACSFLYFLSKHFSQTWERLIRNLSKRSQTKKLNRNAWCFADFNLDITQTTNLPAEDTGDRRQVRYRQPPIHAEKLPTKPPTKRRTKHGPYTVESRVSVYAHLLFLPASALMLPIESSRKPRWRWLLLVISNINWLSKQKWMDLKL